MKYFELSHIIDNKDWQRSAKIEKIYTRFTIGCRILDNCDRSPEEQRHYAAWDDNPPGDALPLKVLGNTDKVNGAACILYPGVLEGIVADINRTQEGPEEIDGINKVILMGRSGSR